MKKILFLVAASLFSAAAIAQGLNFNGSWKLSYEKSQLNPEFSFAPKEVKIIQAGNDFTVEKLSNFDNQDFVTTDKLTLDGKECTNTGFKDIQKESTCVWSDDKASLRIVSKLSIGDGDMTITEEYKIDSTNLVIESRASSSYGDMDETMVFVRK